MYFDKSTVLYIGEDDLIKTRYHFRMTTSLRIILALVLVFAVGAGLGYVWYHQHCLTAHVEPMKSLAVRTTLAELNTEPSSTTTVVPETESPTTMPSTTVTTTVPSTTTPPPTTTVPSTTTTIRTTVSTTTPAPTTSTTTKPTTVRPTTTTAAPPAPAPKAPGGLRGLFCKIGINFLC